MKTTDRRKKDMEFFRRDNHSLFATLIICLVVFLASVFLLIASFNGLISDHDQYLSGEMCTLLSEKVNNSLDAMTENISNVSSVLSAQNFDSPEEIYTKLMDSKKSEYVSIGFIDEEGKIYATKDECEEFAKWKLVEAASRTHPISMSVPYRSSVYGQYVITIFCDFEYGNKKQGTIFTTYLFKSLQDALATKSLLNDIEIMLVNAGSSNLIKCVGPENQGVGSWTNAYLAVQEINEKDRQKYIDGINRMFNGEDNIGMSYYIGDILYSQHSSAITNMPGWYVSVRIPGNALSNTMHTFRNYVLLFTLVLLVVVVILIFNMNRITKRQTKVLERLSIYDPLTGVFNRRAFDYAAQSFLTHGKKCALIFFDVDYFKQVNDNFGHDVGDKLLKTFAAILKDVFESKGIVSRFGGDEFVVLTEMKNIEDISDKLSITSYEIQGADFSELKRDGKDVMFTFSAGAAQYPHDSDDLSGLKKCADNALYIVKEHGRNGYGWYGIEDDSSKKSEK